MAKSSSLYLYQYLNHIYFTVIENYVINSEKFCFV